ncbi:MAG: uracil-DNA glycosylase [Gemmatimonadota bacterium]|nr:uracil-DNA glycosylase [Gemmatimonadota bacterium]MDE2781374.1 uracil-DNA glycosylase [Gemmatimonadota bacterium]MDE2864836.1 uracil-DNA glycosylase [Gemmatimonadota bacterium]
MSRGADRLAAYLDQRRRMREPGIVPSGFSAGELVTFLESRKAASPAAPVADRLQPGSTPATKPSPSTPEGSTSGDAAPTVDPSSIGYEPLRDAALACTRCRLAEGRRHVVFSDGNPAGRLMVVGEAPGAREDATGLPFVGQAGKLLDLMLAAVGLSRADSVYICNVIKCRPPGNRNPLPDEIEACAPFLKGQIRLVAPEVLLAVGSFAAQWLTGTTRPLGKLRGEVYSYEGVPLVVTYHPAALLRNPGWNRLCWDDLQLLRQVMDGS